MSGKSYIIDSFNKKTHLKTLQATIVKKNCKSEAEFIMSMSVVAVFK